MKYYVGITVGPIIKTMSYAYTPGALWFSSYFFSKIVAGLTENMMGKGFDIINQRLNDSGDVDTGFYKEKNQAGIGIYHDRIYASAEANDKKEIDEKIKSALKSVVDSEVENLRTALGLNENNINTFLSNYLQIFWVIFEENEIDFAGKGLSKILADALDALELCTKINFEESNDYLSHLLLGEKNKGNNAYVAKHPYSKYATGINLKNKNGNFKEIINIASQDDELVDDSSKESLDAIRKLDKPKRYYAVVQADGDNMGKLLSVEGGEPDEQEKRIAAFSRLCTDYSEKAVNRIVGYGGTVIYAGGDDLLFLAPVVTDNSNIWILCKEIGEDFFDISKTWLVDMNIQLKANDKRPSVSFGVSINYYKSPIYEAMMDAQSLLFGTAKHYGKKNNVAVTLHKHSGQTQGLVCCLESEKKDIENTNTVYSNLINLVSEIYAKKDEERDRKEQSKNADKLLHSVTYQIESRKELINLILNDPDNRDTMLKQLLVNKFNYDERETNIKDKQLGAIKGYMQAVCDNRECAKSLEDNEMSSILISTLRLCKFLVEEEDD